MRLEARRITLKDFEGLMEDWMDWLCQIDDLAWHGDALPEMTLDTVRMKD